MGVCEKSDAIDRLVWCSNKRKSTHNIKINIRKDSIFEKISNKNSNPLFYIIFFFQKIRTLIKFTKRLKIFVNKLVKLQ